MKSPFRCPVCDGAGTKQGQSVEGSSSNSPLLIPCSACAGRGVVWGGEFEEEISRSISLPVDPSRIFGKNYLIDCSRVVFFPDTQDVIYSFMKEICRVLQVGLSIDTTLFKPCDFETSNGSCFFTNHSSEISITARWNEYYRDFYLDVFSCSSFDEHLIRQVVLRFFEPDMYNDRTVVRRAPYGVGKNFLK